MNWKSVNLLILLAVGGCQTTGNDIGSGSLDLSPRVATAVEGYFRLERPAAMAITTDGSHAARFFCLTDECEQNMTDPRAIDGALKNCRKNAGDRTCLVYAIGRNVVWKGAVARQQSIWNPADNTQNRLILKWEGHDTSGTVRMVAGIATFSPDGKAASMNFQEHARFMGGCEGEAKFETGGMGKWTVRCTEAPDIDGTVRIDKADRSGLGTARDQLNRKVTLEFLPRGR